MLIEDHPPLTETRNELDKLIVGLRCVHRLFDAPTEDVREAFNRWQMAAHERGHGLGNDPHFSAKPDLARLVDAARAAKLTLGAKQRRSHAADPEPIRRIADALKLGWAKAHAGKLIPRYRMPSGTFRQIVQFAYEAIGAERDYLPERALRAYRGWRKRENCQARRRARGNHLICT